MIQVEQHGSVTAIRMARTFLGRPVTWTTVYWLDGLLIDSGPRTLARELVRVVADLSVEQIVVTHGHEEQIGGLALLRERFPHAPIYASPQTAITIADPSRLEMQLYRRLLWGVPKPVADVNPLPLTVTTPRFTLRTVQTPGHSRDHISFFETRHRWLFSGDAFFGGQERSLSRECDLFGVVSSLRTLAALRPERLFPGSGNVRRTPAPEIHGKIAQLIGLCQDVGRLQALDLPKMEIVDRVLGGEGRASFWTQGHISAANLVDACCSYNQIFEPSSASSAPRLRPWLMGASRSLSDSSANDPSAGDSSTNESPDVGDRRSAS